jgi:site-specific DNA-methyltransferase (adenine-specific)
MELIVLARKPLSENTIAANVLRWGTGAMNIDGCRIGINDGDDIYAKNPHTITKGGGITSTGLGHKLYNVPQGRFPSNLIHDGSDEVVGMFPNSKSSDRVRNNSRSWGDGNIYGKGNPTQTGGFSDEGSAARFFYSAKASKADRDDGCEGMEMTDKNTRNSYGEQSDYDCPDGAHRVGNKGTSKAHNYHPCVKPTALMQYLCRLITPPSGTVLDPFMGSGSTGRGAVKEGFSFVGIDNDPAYVEIARRRIDAANIQPLLLEAVA